MKLEQFYQFLRGHAEITLKKNRTTLYNGPLKGIPDDFDNLTVKDFKGTNTGFVFFVE